MVLLNKGLVHKNYQPWIKVVESGFVKGRQPFRFVGASAVNLVFYDNWELDLEKAIRTAKENKISVLRIYMDWGWGKDEDYDKVLNIASKYGIYVILTLTDCCCIGDYPTLKKYFEVHAPFCNITNRESINAFKRRIKQIIERRNSINERIYRDDPAIFAWEIANELEYGLFSDEEVQGWITELASYIKSLDTRHLVTVGISAEGEEFDAENQSYGMLNIPALDFISFHFYCSLEELSKGLAEFEESCLEKLELRTEKFSSMAKPVVVGEFGFLGKEGLNFNGLTNEEKQNMLEVYVAKLKKLMDTSFNTGASGVMFWGWGVPEEKKVPMWWSRESHSIEDNELCRFLKDYQIPEMLSAP